VSGGDSPINPESSRCGDLDREQAGKQLLRGQESILAHNTPQGAGESREVEEGRGVGPTNCADEIEHIVQARGGGAFEVG